MKFEIVENELLYQGFNVISKDFNKPWGGYFVIDECQSQYFADIFFNGININTLEISGKLSPKILVVRPNVRLSWQYHLRRSEIWQIISGTVGVVRSKNNIESELVIHEKGSKILLEKNERHRLVGLNDWGIVAEIWQHTDVDNSSDENDIIRVQDDFGR